MLPFFVPHVNFNFFPSLPGPRSTAFPGSGGAAAAVATPPSSFLDAGGDARGVLPKSAGGVLSSLSATAAVIPKQVSVSRVLCVFMRVCIFFFF